MESKKIIQVVREYFDAKKKDVKSKYDWTINFANLPDCVKLQTNTSLFEQNIELKKALTKQFKKVKDNKTEVLKLIRYYISYWGGIHTNSESTLKSYADSDVDEIIGKGTKGIASWSKALTVFNYEKYAIFDARVSASLNGLIYQETSIHGSFFPILISRNNTIKGFNMKLRNVTNRSSFKPTDTFYREYIKLLTEVANKSKVSIAEIEMSLFAYAEDIANETFKLK